ncbi:MAG: SAM-dependent methyltransferase, partial [Gemmatimonadota bacterium]|nr:SAM-dependent methyltransferase [Gemmatimonadota bacterium]
ERGVFTAEFPHLVRLVAGNEYDTIYHEHYSYFTLLTIGRVLRAHGLEVFDVEELTTHGGSLRIYARHRTDLSRPISDAVRRLEARELDGGYDTLEPYRSFSHRVHAAKRNLLKFLIAAKESGRSVVGYGAPAKGTVLLNYCGIGTDFLDYTTDINPHKQGRFMPGVRIPIHPPTRIAETRPDYVLILPWNLREEIMEQHAYISEWGGRFVTPIPDVKVFQPRVGGSAAFGVAFGH